MFWNKYKNKSSPIRSTRKNTNNKGVTHKKIKFISSNVIGQSESSSAQIGLKIQVDTWFETLLCEDNYDKIYETLQNSIIEEYNECSIQ